MRPVCFSRLVDCIICCCWFCLRQRCPHHHRTGASIHPFTLFSPRVEHQPSTYIYQVLQAHCLPPQSGLVPCSNSVPSCKEYSSMFPRRVCYPCVLPCQCNTQGSLSNLKRAPSPSTKNVTSKSPVGDIPVVTLIRTDTTPAHSQKAEKVWIGGEKLSEEIQSAM